MKPQAVKAAERLCGVTVTHWSHVSGGGNSQVWHLITPSGDFALKVYPQTSPDFKLRLAREFSGYSFVSARPDSGLRTPKPIARDADLGLGIFEWLDGVRPTRSDPHAFGALMEAVQAFRHLSEDPAAADLMEATDATFSVQTLRDQITTRRARFSEVLNDEPRLASFLHGDFARAEAKALVRLKDWERRTGAEARGRLQRSACVLSPSDFGLHNSLWLNEGGLALLDFEYFGWDDPVRLLGDVICHPAMSLHPAQRAAFIAKTAPVFLDHPAFLPRFEAFAPMIALRWALIVLNEFLPNHWHRRQSAGNIASWDEAKAAQLAKAKAQVAACDSFLATSWQEVISL